MPTFQKFTEIDCWKKARILENYVFKLTQNALFIKDFGLKDQINKSTGSIMDNIAEGFGRGGNKEFVNFLIIAKASAIECESQIIRALDRNYISIKEFNESKILLNETQISISGFIVFLRKNYERTIRKPI